MLNIGFRAHDFGSFLSADDLGRRIEEIKSDSVIQLALGKVIPSSKPWKEWDEEYISSVINTLRQHGVKVAIIGCYINPVHPDAEKRQLEIERFKKSLSLTKAFECPYVATETGTQNPKGGYSTLTSDPKFVELFYSSLSQMVESAAKYDSYVVIEGVNHTHTISSPLRMAKMLEKFPTKHLKVLFDPVNLLPFEGIAEEDGVPLAHPSKEAQHRFYSEVLDIYKDRLVAIHCKDYKLDETLGNKIWNLPALTGVFDWKGFAEELRRRAIDVPWLLENFNPETVKETVHTLETF